MILCDIHFSVVNGCNYCKTAFGKLKQLSGDVGKHALCRFVFAFCKHFSGNILHLKAYKFKDFLVSILCGLYGTIFYYVFYYSATAIMPASQAFIINYLWPIMSVVFACILLKEKLTVKKEFQFVK